MMSSQPSSAPLSPPPSSPPPPPVLGFPAPASPMAPPPVRLQMHGGSGVHVGTFSDEDGDDDDDDDDEFEDSEQTEATAAGTDAEESMTSEGELCATPESGPRSVAVDDNDKWVAVKGQVLAALPQLLSTPVVPGSEAVHATAIVSATATAAHHHP
jgi:hypothetical protein